MPNTFKYFLAFVGLFSLSFSKLPDKKFPPGMYMEFEELKMKSPSVHCRLKIEARAESLQFWWGGSDFKLSSPDNCVSKRLINSEAWAYVDDSTVYLNCRKLQLEQYAYARALTYGRFLAFSNKTLKESIAAAALFGGVAGGAIAASATKQPFESALWVVDVSTAKLFSIDSAYMTKALKDYPDVYKEFKKEFDKNDAELHLKYLQMANDAE